jgi:hypothetical protein
MCNTNKIPFLTLLCLFLVIIVNIAVLEVQELPQLAPRGANDKLWSLAAHTFIRIWLKYII